MLKSEKKPLLIRNALPTDISPISADELAGLACEEHVESRLIIQNGEQWNLQIGPFDEKTFAQLPPSHCTLLVQALDHHIPAAAELLEKFNFIPNVQYKESIEAAIKSIPLNKNDILTPRPGPHSQETVTKWPGLHDRAVCNKGHLN